MLAACAAPDRWTRVQPDWKRVDADAAREAGVPEGQSPGSPGSDGAGGPGGPGDGPPFELPDGDGPVPLSIEQATMLALRHNKDLAVQQLEPVRAGAFEQIERGVFDPELYAELAYENDSSTEVARSTGEQFGVDANERTAAAGVRQDLPTGTNIDVGLTQDRTSSNRTPEQESARVGLTVTQALLRGRGAVVNLAGVRQAELGVLASRHELRGFTEALVAEANVAYWRYVLSRRQIAIFEESLAVARRQLDEVRQRIEVGVLADTELAVARTEVALREQALIDARSLLEERRLRLLRLVSPSLEGAFDRPIEPTSDAQIEPEPIDDLADRIVLAVRSRPDLLEARVRAEQDRLEVVVTRNGLLPRLDVFLTLGKTGYADSFFDSFGDLGGDGFDVSVGLSLSRALGNREAKGRAQLARATARQAAAAVANLEQIVHLDVRLAANEVERARRQIGATAATRALQEETVAAERQRFDVGTSTGLLVAQAQRDLLEAQIDEVSAVVQYRIALVELYRAEGTLLARRGVAITFDGAPN
jgi:outer membrane protein TolC